MIGIGVGEEMFARFSSILYSKASFVVDVDAFDSIGALVLWFETPIVDKDAGLRICETNKNSACGVAHTYS